MSFAVMSTQNQSSSDGAEYQRLKAAAAAAAASSYLHLAAARQIRVVEVLHLARGQRRQVVQRGLVVLLEHFFLALVQLLQLHTSRPPSHRHKVSRTALQALPNPNNAARA